MIILIIGIFLISFFNAQASAEQRSKDDGLFSVSQLQYHCDSSLQQAWRITNLAYINSHSQSFMSGGINSDNHDTLSALHSFCSSYHYTHPAIFEIGFYSIASQTAYAVSNNLSSPYFSQTAQRDGTYSNLFAFIDETDANKSIFFCEKRNNYTPYLLTLIRTNTTKNGATFLSLDLFSLLDNLPNDQHTEFYIISHDGTLLCSTQNKGIGNPVTELELFSGEWDWNEATQYRTSGNQKLLYSTTKSEMLDIYYVAVQTPSSALFLSTQMLYIIISVLFIIAIASLLLIMIPKNISHSLSPINKLLGNDLDKADKKDNMNLTLVAEQIVSLLGHNADLQSSIGNKIEELRQLNTKALQYQINPHFIYNTLNLVNTIAIRDFGNEHAIATIMRKLSKILRYSLDTSSDLVPIDKELEHTQSYIDIMQMCYPNLFTVTYSVSDDLMHCEVPRMSFQPLIENAIYHGIHPKGSGTIHLSVEQCNDMLKISIRDDGIGMTPEQIDELNSNLQRSDIGSNRIGLANIHRRIQLLFGESYGLSLSAEKGHGTCLIETLPITTEYVKNAETP